MAVALATTTDWMLAIALAPSQQKSHAVLSTQARCRLNQSGKLTFDFWDRQLWQALATRRRFRAGRPSSGSGSGGVLGVPGEVDYSDISWRNGGMVGAGFGEC